MKKYLLLFTAAILAISFSSCEKENSEEVKAESSFKLVTDKEALASYLEPVNQQVIFKGDNANDLNYTWMYNLSALEIGGGQSISASAVDGYEDAVYVGWHTRGPAYYGHLININIMDSENPFVQSHFFLPDHDINDIEVKTNVDRLFIAGSSELDLEGNSVGDRNAMAAGFDIDADGNYILGNDNYWMEYFYGSSANSITYIPSETVWISKGSRGGLTTVKDFNRSDVRLDLEVANSKHFDATGDYGVLLSGTGFNESVLRVWDMNDGDFYVHDEEFTIPFDVTDQGKNGVDINGNYAYLAMGNDGVVKVDLRDGDVEGNFDNESGAFCNGVAVDWRYVYAAYGSDGLFVLDKNTMEVVGNWDFNGSCNYVKKVGDYLFLANGDTDGLIMLKKD